MDVIVSGCKDPLLEAQLIDAAKFFGNKLLSKRMLPHIFVEITMKTKMNDLGNCCVTYYNDWYKPREFEIELRRHRSLKSTLITLAHEMVHLKQFAKCELNTDWTRWQGQSFDPEAVSYHDYPWEIEASSMEYILYAAYVEKIQ
mgnify:CR=1 FL=1